MFAGPDTNIGVCGLEDVDTMASAGDTIVDSEISYDLKRGDA